MLRKLFVVLTAVLVLAACTPGKIDLTATPEATADTSITLTDGLGRTVSLPTAARRVVSLAPSNTEILFAVGAGAQVAGRDMFSDYPAEAASVQDIGGSMGDFNKEAIVALQPDLVLAGGINPPELVASLEALGLKVYFLPNPTTLEEMYANLETVGKLTGHGSEAAVLVDKLQARVAAVDAVILPLNSRPSVYYEIDATNPASPYTYGPGTFGDLLIQRAGGFNIGSKLEGQFTTISLEQLVTDNPSVVLLGDAIWGETPEKFAARPGMVALDAVKNQQVFPFDDYLVSRPGPRLVDGLEAMARLLHPGVFK
jgi:iron complex transport system substrate-binding protein